MIKKLFSLFLFLPCITFAQLKDTKHYYEVFCLDLASLEATLNEFGEIPFTRGSSSREPLGKVPLVIFVNPKTGSWSIVEKIDTNFYCVLGIGTGFEAVPSEKKSEVYRSREKNSF